MCSINKLKRRANNEVKILFFTIALPGTNDFVGEFSLQIAFANNAGSSLKNTGVFAIRPGAMQAEEAINAHVGLSDISQGSKS